MGITVACTRVACNTSTGTQDITPLGSTTPKAAFFIATYGVTDGTAADHAVMAVGAATGSANRWASYQLSEHGQANADAYRRGVTDECICIPATDGTVDGEADFDSFISGGVRINWGNAPSSAYLLTVILFAGSDLSAHANTFTTPATQDTATDVTDPGFEPDLVICATTGDAFDDTNDTNGINRIGFAANAGGQGGMGIGSGDGALVGNPSNYLSDAYVYNGYWTDGTNYGDTELADWDSSGFSAYARTASGGYESGYLALKFGGVVDFWVGVIDSPASTGDDAQTGPSFKPQFVALLPTWCQAVDTGYVDADAGAHGFAAFDADDEYCNSIAEEDASATTDTQSLSDDAAINFPKDDGSAGFVASFSSFDTNGWTLNFTTVDGTTRKWLALAIGAESDNDNVAGKQALLASTPRRSASAWHAKYGVLG